MDNVIQLPGSGPKAPVRTTRPRGFAPWRPRKASQELLDHVQDVLDQYREHLPLTARQIFYRLVGTIDYEKTEKGYARLCELLNRARRAKLIPFSSIRDDGASRYEALCFLDDVDFLETVREDAQGFRLDRQEGQPLRLWTLCEAGGMAPMLGNVAGPFGVPVLTSGGFDSVTAKHALAVEVAGALRHHEQCELLHIGDLDPSGEHLFLSLAEDVCAMCRALCGFEPRFTRLAVTRRQAVELNLPTAPAKTTDRRRFEGSSTVQAEAIAPDVLTSILRDAITARRDSGIADDVLDLEAMYRRDLLARLDPEGSP